MALSKNSQTNTTLNNHDFTKLDQSLLDAFSTLGIHSAEDLAHLSAESVWSDLQKLKEYFPDQEINISLSYLRTIHKEAQLTYTGEGKAISLDISIPLLDEEERTIADHSDTAREAKKIVKPLPKFRPARGSRLYHQNKEQQANLGHHSMEVKEIFPRQEKGMQTKNNAMRCRKSYHTFFAALLTLIMVPSLFIMSVAFIAALIMGIEIDLIVKYVAIYLVAFVAYILYRGRVRCQVCHIPTFTLREYPHNKYAHRFFGLGYNISTALHILFTFWFRCPACGTAVRVFKPKRKS